MVVNAHRAVFAAGRENGARGEIQVPQFAHLVGERAHFLGESMKLLDLGDELAVRVQGRLGVVRRGQLHGVLERDEVHAASPSESSVQPGTSISPSGSSQRLLELL